MEVFNDCLVGPAHSIVCYSADGKVVFARGKQILLINTQPLLRILKAFKQKEPNKFNQIKRIEISGLGKKIEMGPPSYKEITS